MLLEHSPPTKVINGPCQSSSCVGCGCPIQDQYILHVAPDQEWHAACLRCADCHRQLDETCTCFVRDGKPYCRNDYLRLFSTKCSGCNGGFTKSDLVMRAHTRVFHIDCFRCVACSRQLIPGEEFALKDEGVYCKDDADALVCHSSRSESPASPENNNNNNNTINNIGNKKIKIEKSERNHKGPNSEKRRENKGTRIRTVMNEKQLRTLRTCYNANPRPDALMKEQLTEMTGLSSRVIRVWFQNHRCKDKKRTILIKKMQQENEQNKNTGRLRGIPMVASSPVFNESTLSSHAYDIQSYRQPWSTGPDGHQSWNGTLDDHMARNGVLEDHMAPPQQLVNPYPIPGQHVTPSHLPPSPPSSHERIGHPMYNQLDMGHPEYDDELDTFQSDSTLKSYATPPLHGLTSFLASQSDNLDNYTDLDDSHSPQPSLAFRSSEFDSPRTPSEISS